MLPNENIVPLAATTGAPNNAAKQNDVSPADRAGSAIVSMLRQTAQATRENCERAIGAVNKLQAQLQEVQERDRKLEADLKHFQERALRAEKWLAQIQREIEEGFAKVAMAGRVELLPPGLQSVRDNRNA